MSEANPPTSDAPKEAEQAPPADQKPAQGAPGEDAEKTPSAAYRPARAAPGEEVEERRKRSWLRPLGELPILLLLAFVIAVLIKTFLVQAFYIPSGSMRPTLDLRDRVLVEKVSYRFRDPKPGDVVVFARSVFGPRPNVPWYEDVANFFKELLGLPTGREQDYIKRIVAVSGDSVRYSGEVRRLVVNGRRVPEPYVEGGADRVSSKLENQDCLRLEMRASEMGCVVPEGKVFVMGDNRDNSEDSRMIGPIDEDKLVGHAFLVLWPPNHFRPL